MDDGSSPLTRGKPWIARCAPLGWRLIPAHAGKTHQPTPGVSKNTAHPRSRGENGVLLLTHTTGGGSSPLTRGKRCGEAVGEGEGGLIPAHAGKTHAASRESLIRGAHPRSRGENLIGAVRTLVVTGSSPLTRGKRFELEESREDTGLIPAHAGKTWGIMSTSGRSPAHPRSRGENCDGAFLAESCGGSSPLTRGKRRDLRDSGATARLIPAHAGKTGLQGQDVRSVKAHPRSRGENSRRTRTLSRRSGSSPLTRGKRVAFGQEGGSARLIPAHAGKTPPHSVRTGARPAHPRSRGENPSISPSASFWTGSSPLTRGKRRIDALMIDKQGLIPAHAGKTTRCAFCSLVVAAHPRSRGENHSAARLKRRRRGSSPLTRGKRS